MSWIFLILHSAMFRMGNVSISCSSLSIYSFVGHDRRNHPLLRSGKCNQPTHGNSVWLSGLYNRRCVCPWRTGTFCRQFLDTIMYDLEPFELRISALNWTRANCVSCLPIVSFFREFVLRWHALEIDRLCVLNYLPCMHWHLPLRPCQRELQSSMSARTVSLQVSCFDIYSTATTWIRNYMRSVISLRTVAR